MTEAPKGRGRPRKADADRRILEAAVALLGERGYRDFTVDVVSERTGIAKTTIYRRWPSKAELVAAAIAPPSPDLSAEAIVAETERLLTLLRDADTVDILRAVIAPRHAALVALVGNEEADVRIGRLVARFVAP